MFVVVGFACVQTERLKGWTLCQWRWLYSTIFNFFFRFCIFAVHIWLLNPPRVRSLFGVCVYVYSCWPFSLADQRNSSTINSPTGLSRPRLLHAPPRRNSGSELFCVIQKQMTHFMFGAYAWFMVLFYYLA